MALWHEPRKKSEMELHSKRNSNDELELSTSLEEIQEWKKVSKKKRKEIHPRKEEI